MFENTSDLIPIEERCKVQYNLEDYMNYEECPLSDDVKKNLETGHMLDVVKDLENRTNMRTALDIGCATGRWSSWIARRGYEAHGYDVSQVAIDICNMKSSQNSNLDMTFTLHDISDGALVDNHFSLVTCMMGTLNHVPKNRLSAFLEGIVHTMRTDGLFAFTYWNVASPFCEFLQIDNQNYKNILKSNSMDMESLELILQNSKLRILRIIPMCSLPNKCYDVWDDSAKDVNAIELIDACLRENLKESRPQMYFIVVEKLN